MALSSGCLQGCAGSLAFNYDIDRIREEEEKRAVDIKERLSTSR
jgi:hypothetical protein